MEGIFRCRSTSIGCKNGLNECGFIETIVHRRPQRGGLPIPWFTFPAIAFLDSRDLVGKKVVEIGSGYSTLYFEQRGCFGVSLETDSDWARSVGRALREISDLPGLEVQELKPAEVKTYSSQSSYGGESITDRSLRLGVSDSEVDQRRFVPSLSAALTKHISDADLVVIDGALRNMCMSIASQHCKEDAMILVDNSERTEYKDGISELARDGWEPIEFEGLGPINPYTWKTTIWTK